MRELRGGGGGGGGEFRRFLTLLSSSSHMKSVRYRDEIWRPIAVPLVQQRNQILQQDNARPHVARVCQDFLANNNIAPLAWPPYSPGLRMNLTKSLDRETKVISDPVLG